MAKKLGCYYETIAGRLCKLGLEINNELETIINHQKLLNQKKYCYEKEIEKKKKKLKDNKDKMECQSILTSQKQSDSTYKIKNKTLTKKKVN